MLIRPWLLLVFVLPSNMASANLRFEEGIARDPDSHRSIYREQHWVRFSQQMPVERLVLYRCIDGTPFARKRVNYQPSAQAPAFEFIDVRKGYVEGLRYQQNKAALWYRPPGKAPE